MSEKVFASRSGLTCVVLVTLCFLGAACTLSRPARHADESGFLADYSILHKGKKGQAQMVYARAGVDWAAYHKILLDPVTLWRSADGGQGRLSQAEAQKLADYFYGVIYRTFSRGYDMVRAPGPDTLRVQVAITELGASHVVLDVVSSVEPHARAATGLYELISGKPAFEGQAAVEARVTDAESGELLAAGVDHRIGKHTLNAKSLQSWGDVQNIMTFWADRAYYNLCTLQGKSDCGKRPDDSAL